MTNNYLHKKSIYRNNYLKVRPNRVGLDDFLACSFFLFGSGKKHFHIRRVSSAPAESTVEPSGDMAKFKMRFVCPVSSATFRMGSKKKVTNVPYNKFDNVAFGFNTFVKFTFVKEGYFQIVN